MTTLKNEWSYAHSFGVIRSDSPGKTILVLTQRKYYCDEEYGYHFWKLTTEADDIIQRKTADELKAKFCTENKIYTGVESDSLLHEVHYLYPKAEIFKNISNQEVTPLQAPQLLLDQIKEFYKDAEFSFSKKGITFSTTPEFNFHIYFGIPRKAPSDTSHNAQLVAFLSNYIVEKHFPNGSIRIASQEEYTHAARMINEHLETLTNKTTRKIKIHL